MNQRIANEKLITAGQHINILPNYFKHLRAFVEYRSNSEDLSIFMQSLDHRCIKKLQRLDRYDLITTSLLVLSSVTKDPELMIQTINSLLERGLSKAVNAIEYYKALLGYLQRYRTYRADPQIVSDIISVYGMRLVDCEYLDFLGDSIIVQRGSTIADQTIKSKETLFVIEQGMNVLAGSRRLLITILMEKISGMLEKFKEGLLAAITGLPV